MQMCGCKNLLKPTSFLCIYRVNKHSSSFSWKAKGNKRFDDPIISTLSIPLLCQISHLQIPAYCCCCFFTECRDLVRKLLNPDQYYRLSAEQAFQSSWCSKAIYDNPHLSYLEEYLKPVYMRKPIECAPRQTDKFGKFRERLVGVSHLYSKTH